MKDEILFVFLNSCFLLLGTPVFLLFYCYFLCLVHDKPSPNTSGLLTWCPGTIAPVSGVMAEVASELQCCTNVDSQS